MSRNAMPATVFARGCHCAQPCQCDVRKTRNTTRLKCCACHEKLSRTRPKCWACHEKCHACLENVAKALRLPRKTIFHTLPSTRPHVTKCHACHAKGRWMTCKTSKNTPPVKLPRGTANLRSNELFRTLESGTERTHLNRQTPKV